MYNHQDFHQLIKLTEPNLALDRNLQFQNLQAEYLGKGILKMRQQIQHLAKDLNRSISNQGQLHDYLTDLIAFQQLHRQLAPIHNIRQVMDQVLRLSVDLMKSDGALLYLWGEVPLTWHRKGSFRVSETVETAVEAELERRSILDGSEQDPLVVPFYPGGQEGEGSLILVPLVAGQRQLGAFISYVKTSHLNFFGHHLNIFAMLGRGIAIALENAWLFEKVHKLSVRDDLTDLYNARFMRAYLKDLLGKAHEKNPIALFYTDLDEFKQVNDQFGHLTGSRTLVDTAQLIQPFATDRDCVCRYGGDEFVLAFPGLTKREALEMAEAIRFAIEIHDFQDTSGMRFNLTTSVGLALYPQDAGTIDDLIHHADMAMYKAKAEGKNRVCGWQPG